MPDTLFYALLAIATAGNVALSWRSLGVPRSHGFYRFFAFELILILFLLNVTVWFDDPFSIPHTLSWLLLIASIIPALGGYCALRRGGQPSAAVSIETNLPFENTSHLVTTGIYRYIRHPMYASLLMLAWGIMLKAPSWTGLLIAACTTVFLLATARAEEKENLLRFGEEYRAFMRHTRKFIPFVV